MNHPPNFPKPSSSNAAKNRLKNRLILGWQKNHGLASISEDSKIYGERQFDHDDGNFLTITDAAYPKKNSISVDGADEHRLAEKLNFTSEKLRSKTGASSSTLQNNKSISHLSVSQTFQSTGSWDEIANNLTFGRTEFCYLEQTFHDHYKFNIKDNFPTTILSNQYITLSKHGVLTSTEGGVAELTSYNELANELDMYNKLKKINFFSKFRLWKTIYLWRYVVRKTKFKNTSESLQNSLFFLHEFFSKMIIVVMSCCIDIETLSVFKFNTISDQSSNFNTIIDRGATITNETKIYDIDKFIKIQQKLQKKIVKF